MKKRNVLNLIRYYSEGNDVGFRTEAYQIARDFDSNGDYQLSEYIMSLLSDANTFVPQMNEDESYFFEKIDSSCSPLPLPESIQSDVLGIANAIAHNMGVNKFLFKGAPGTGKTETVKQLSRILNRDLYMVDFSSIIDSKLGQTQKNISELFKELNNFVHPEKVLILFDEIDAIAMDRTNPNDLREMGRATSSILKGFDGLDDRIGLIATTNLYEKFDKALIRRFDKVIDFDRYTIVDLQDVAEAILTEYLSKFKYIKKDIKFFRKIVGLMNPVLSPGELKNQIKTAIAFSSENNGFEYLRRLYFSICKSATTDLKVLQSQGFTLREIEQLTGISKSQVAREIKDGE